MSLLSIQSTHGCFRIWNLRFSLDTDNPIPRYSFHLSFLHCIKVSVRLDEQRPITKSFAGCSLLPVEFNQSLLTSVWTSLASCKSLSLVNLVRPLHWFWWDVWGIHIQLKPLKLIPVIEAWLDKVVHQEIVFKRRLYSTHLQCKNMIYLLTLFWNNFLNLAFFSSYYTKTSDLDSHGTSGSYNLSTRINGSHVFSSNMF